MIEVRKAPDHRRSCNGCTRRVKGFDTRDFFDVSSDDPDRNMVLSYCEDCLYELGKEVRAALRATKKLKSER